MAALTSNPDLMDEALEILRRCAKGKGSSSAYHFLTAYQILERLEAGSRDRLIEAYGKPGKGGGKHFGAARAISRMMQNWEKKGWVEICYMDSVGLLVNPAWDTTTRSAYQAGYPLTSIFRYLPKTLTKA